MRLAVLALAMLPLAAPGEPAAAQVQIPAPELDGAYLRLGFDRLSGYKFVTPEYDPLANPKAPAPSGRSRYRPRSRAGAGRRPIITGLHAADQARQNGKAVEFLLMANQMACCYGTVPNMNDWVIVRIPKGVPITQDVPISFRGTLQGERDFRERVHDGHLRAGRRGPRPSRGVSRGRPLG